MVTGNGDHIRAFSSVRNCAARAGHMIEEYVDAFQTLVDQAESSTGITVPWELKQYTVAVLAHYLDKPDVTLGKTFAELWLTADTVQDCKTVGDQALVVSGAWPKYRLHRGVNREYVSRIGASAYARCGREPFSTLGRHFGVVRELVAVTVNQDSRERVKWVLAD